MINDFIFEIPQMKINILLQPIDKSPIKCIKHHKCAGKNESGSLVNPLRNFLRSHRCPGVVLMMGMMIAGC